MTMTGAKRAADAGSGAQAVDRACMLLKLVAAQGPDGARLSDIAAHSKLSRPTVHRLLQSLVTAGFVRQDDRRRYQLGTALFELGLAAPSPVARLTELRPVIDDLARETGDTAFLAVRRGDEMLYVARAEGSFPVRVHVIREGDRLPMPASGAGIAILATMTKKEVDGIFERRAALIDDEYPWASQTVIKRLIEQVRRDGYMLGEGTIAPGITGLGYAVRGGIGTPYMGVSISAISSRVTPGRLPKLVSLLKEASDRITAILT